MAEFNSEERILSIKKKVEELKVSSWENVDDTIDNLLRSGSIDLESWDDNYMLPKILLSEALRRVADSWDYSGEIGLADFMKDTIRNITYF